MPARYIAPTVLEETARGFLAEYHESLEPPVPIEEIVEFRLGLDIVPVQNLRREFDTESWLSHDQRAIYVDQQQLEEHEFRYRFTLAHEVSHLLLHSDVYSGRQFGTVEEWLRFQAAFDPDLLDKVEWQARNLAGRLLVPTNPLTTIAQGILDEQRGNIPAETDPETLWGYVAAPISRRFNVSDSVVYRRLTGDGIGKRLTFA